MGAPRSYAVLSIGTALAIIALKAGAYRLTGSVGLLSDALESLINLVAAAPPSPAPVPGVAPSGTGARRAGRAPGR